MEISNPVLLEISSKSIFIFGDQGNESHIVYQLPIASLQLQIGQANNKFVIKSSNDSFIFQSSAETFQSWVDAFYAAQNKGNTRSSVAKRASTKNFDFVLPSFTASQPGYLMKCENREKKLWVRHWFSVDGKFLVASKSELVCFSSYFVVHLL